MSQRFDYEDHVVGSDPVCTGTAIIKSGFNGPAFTPLMLETASKKLVIWDGTAGKAVGLTALDVDASGGDKKAPVYKTGSFNIDSVQWPDGTTEEDKYSAFAGTAISVGTLA